MNNNKREVLPLCKGECYFMSISIDEALFRASIHHEQQMLPNYFQRCGYLLGWNIPFASFMLLRTSKYIARETLLVRERGQGWWWNSVVGNAGPASQSRDRHKRHKHCSPLFFPFLSLTWTLKAYRSFNSSSKLKLNLYSCLYVRTKNSKTIL